LSSAACAAPACIGSRVCEAVIDESRRAEAPVEYKTISIVRCDKLSAASMSRATSSTQDLRQATCGFGIRRILEQVAPVQRLHEEEPQCRHMQADCPRAHLPLAEQIRLVGPKVALIQSIRRQLKLTGELLDRVKIRRDRGGREVTALELLQPAAALGRVRLSDVHPP
jgi:hypothetical protein